MEQAHIAIDGMTCGHCVAAVRRALESVPGVQVQDVTIGSATVAYDAGTTTLEAIRDAVRDEGYDPHDGGLAMPPRGGSGR